MSLSGGIGILFLRVLFVCDSFCFIWIYVISLGLRVCGFTGISESLCVGLPPGPPAASGPRMPLCCLSVLRNVRGEGRGEHTYWAAGLLVMENY